MENLIQRLASRGVGAPVAESVRELAAARDEHEVQRLVHEGGGGVTQGHRFRHVQPCRLQAAAAEEVVVGRVRY